MRGSAIFIGVLFVLAIFAGCVGKEPTDITATAVAGGIQVSWNAVEGVSGYNLYRSTQPGEAGTKINPQLVTGTTSYTDTQVVDGTTYYYTVKSVDAGGAEQGASQASATAKTRPPQNLMISINNGANYTISRTVTLSLSATGAVQCRFSSDGGSWSDWETYATQKTWGLVSGDGPKDVYYQCRDSIGNTAPSVSASIYLDTTPPTLSVSSPLSGGQYPAGFDLIFIVTDPVSNTVTCSGDLDGNPVEIGVVQTGTQNTITITAKSGSRTLNVRCADAAQQSASRSIAFTVVDKPTVSIILGDGSGYTSSYGVNADVKATHATDCRFSSDGTNWGNWKPYTESNPVQLSPQGDGTKYVYVECRGAGGTVSNPAHDTIILDTSPPPYISISINNGARWTNSRTATLGLYAFAADQCRFCEGDIACLGYMVWGPWESYTTRKAFILSSGEGDKTIYYNCKKRNGDDVGTASATITYSSIPPDPPTSLSITINNGASYTTSRGVTLSLHARYASECRVRQNNHGWSDWQDYRTSMSFSLSGSDGSKTIYYECRNDYGSDSTSASIYLDTSPPPPVTDLSGSAGYNSISLSWSRPYDSGSGVVAYDIYKSNTALGLFTKIASTSSPHYVDYEVSDGATYAYYVRSRDVSGQESDNSNLVTVTYPGPFVGPVY